MIRTIVASLSFCFVNIALTQDPPAIEWQRNLGGSLDDTGASVEQTSDGGYILCGTTYSTNGDVSGNHGNGDIWVVKLNATGDITWQRCLGGSQPDIGKRALELAGGGYLVLGSTRSDDSDVSGNHGVTDFWLARLDVDGEPIWQRCYGGSLSDVPFALEQTPDGGYVVAGESRSSDGDLTANAGFADYWVLKLDANFDIQWQRSYGGSGGETAYALALTSDGGYILNGYTDSNDGDISGAIGSGDYWVVKLEQNGNIQWQRPCGSSNIDYGFSVLERADGTILAFGDAGSIGGDVTTPQGGSDCWLVHLDTNGQLISEWSYGGSATDRGRSILHPSANGLLFSAASQSTDGDVNLNNGSFDGWLVRVNDTGEMVWSMVLGGSQSDGFGQVIETASEGGYILLGGSVSNDGDLPGNQGGADIWLIKLGPDPVGLAEFNEPALMEIHPNPCADFLYVKSPCSEGHPSRWQIIDAQGKQVSYGTNATSNAPLTTIGLVPGPYTVLMECATQRVAAPFVKQ